MRNTGFDATEHSFFSRIIRKIKTVVGVFENGGLKKRRMLIEQLGEIGD